MLAHRSSRLIKGLFNGVMVLGLAAAFLGSLQVWQKRGVTSEAAAAGPVVLINETGFDPATLTVSLNEAVTWLNNTSQPVEIGSSRYCYQYLPLLVAGEDEGDGVAAAAVSNMGNTWHSGLIAPGDIYSTTFGVEGDYLIYLDCRDDVSGVIMVRSATPTPIPTHTPTKTYTPSPTSSFTPGPSPTSTPLNTPTSTIGPSPTATGPNVCRIDFEGPVVAGSQFVPVKGDLGANMIVPVHLYWVNATTSQLIAQAVLEDNGSGPPCSGQAEFYIDPSQFVLTANMLLIVTNVIDGSFAYTVVLAGTPSPTSTPTIGPSPTPDPGCSVRFVWPLYPGQTVIPIHGTLYAQPTTVELYRHGSPITILLGNTELSPSGTTPCTGIAGIDVSAVLPQGLEAGTLISVHNLVDGTFAYSFVLNITPTPTSGPGCPVHFVNSPYHGQTVVTVLGIRYGTGSNMVQLKQTVGSNQTIVGSAELLPSGGAPCNGMAHIDVSASLPNGLLGGSIAVVEHLGDGSSSAAIVLFATPTPFAP
jgi:plastocyanin